MLFKVLSIFSLFIFVTSNPIGVAADVNGNVRRQWDESEEGFDVEEEWSNDAEWDDSFFDEEPHDEEDTSEPGPTGSQQVRNDPFILIQAGEDQGMDSSNAIPAVEAKVRI